MHELRMPEAHLDFRGVDVHVHFFGGQIEEQQYRRENGGWQDISVRFMNCVQNQAVAHEAPIHKNINPIAVAALHVGPRGKAVRTSSSAPRSSEVNSTSVIAARM